jgi:hypothetical protein
MMPSVSWSRRHTRWPTGNWRLPYWSRMAAWSVLAYRYLPVLEEQVVLAVHDAKKGI